MFFLQIDPQDDPQDVLRVLQVNPLDKDTMAHPLFNPTFLHIKSPTSHQPGVYYRVCVKLDQLGSGKEPVTPP